MHLLVIGRKPETTEKDADVTIVFKKTDNNKWNIGLKYHEKIYDKLDGFLYIHHLLERPNVFISATALYDLKPKHGTASNKIDLLEKEYEPSESIALESSDSRTLKDTRGVLKNLEEEEERLRESVYNNPEDALRLKEVCKEIKGCRDYLKKNTHLGRSRVIDKVSDQCKQKVQKAIIKALNKITESDTETAKYINKIETGKDCRFILDNPSALIIKLY